MSDTKWSVASVGRREVNNPGSTAEIFGVRRHRPLSLLEDGWFPQSPFEFQSQTF